jgi:O-antigen/teichoic acid export membrane protein
VSALVVLFAAINGVQLGIVTGLEDFRTMALMNTIRGIVLFITLSLGCYLFGLDGAVAGLAAAEALAAVNQFALRRSCCTRSIPLRHSHLPRGELLALAHFAVPTLLASLVISPAFWLSNLIMFQQPAGARSLGVFNAADRWRQVLLFLPGSVATIILPMLSNLRGTRDSATYRRVLRLNLLANLVVVAIPAIVVIAAARWPCLPLAQSIEAARLH